MGLSFDTVTVAELFLRQGHPARALSIYRRIVSKNPGNEAAVARLKELESSAKGMTMDFRKMMQQLLESTPGALACTLMGFDGIPIDTVKVDNSEIDLQALLTELSSLAAIAKGLKDNHPTGPLSNLALDSDNMTAVVRPVTEEYFIAMVLSPSGLPGRAAFEMRLATPALVTELT